MRVTTAVVTLTAISLAVFWVTEVLPGDAVGVLAGAEATQAERDAVRVALGLDRPAAERYGEWILGALRGELGVSLVSGREVAATVGARLGATAAVLVPAAAGILILATGLGVAAGLRPGGRVDRVLSGATLTLIATPDFLLATALLLVFTVWVPLAPAVALVPAGDTLWQHPGLVMLPAAALAAGGFGATMRLLRASVAQTVATPYVEFARLNGIGGLPLLRTIALNAAPPAVHAYTVMIAGLFGGAIVVETLFNVPGLGAELARAVGQRDVPLVQGLGLAISAAVLAVLLCGDILTRILQHRTQRQETP
ncbi:ABC transporter permease [Microbacterium sp.]|uniref:ABC transporter permease n=1 Tax=Microbacterium sp. TaxID=51671 RepID=UPI003A83A036